jgi:hypothetical protein
MMLSHQGIQIHDFMADLGSIPPHPRVTASYSTGHASLCVWMGGTFSCELNGEEGFLSRGSEGLLPVSRGNFLFLHIVNNE